MPPSKPATYTQTLVDIRDCLQQIDGLLQKPRTTMPSEVILVRLDTLDRRQEEMIELLKTMNGRVRGHAELLARQDQWMEDHVAATHTALQKDVEYAVKSTKIVAVVDTALAFIAGVLGLSKFSG
jgi:gamma-glutamyl phosphate reductase